MKDIILRRRYTQQVNIAIDFIAANIKNNLNLKKIADTTIFSPYHFHRIFKSFTGETVQGFIKRVRLEKAGTMLVNNPEYSVTDIVYKVGLSSSQSFARDFKKYFACTPSEYRTKNTQSKNGYIKSKNWQVAPTLFVYDPVKGRHIMKKYLT